MNMRAYQKRILKIHFFLKLMETSPEPYRQSILAIQEALIVKQSHSMLHFLDLEIRGHWIY
ncbi:hypothetical protein RP29_00930 [Acidovorax temperans]|uniref:Uncharacterized protein n=1 Tax=Acidovorax temperans TaxID=80878 RepID=A0A0D7KEU4_9BURK|nr:hypothetical protein RP29_00930 [Acidovorax temperans]